MTVTVEFEDNANKYAVDIFRLTKRLNITEEQIIQAVQDILSKS